MSSATEALQRQHYEPLNEPKESFLFGMTLRTSAAFLVLAVVAVGLILWLGLLTGLPIAVVMLAAWLPTAIRFRRLTLWQWWVLWRQWRAHVKKGEHMYLSGLFSRVPGGTNALPGVAYATRMHEGWVQHQSRQKYGCIEMPDTHQFTIVIECFPQGNEAVDQASVDVSVFNWGTVIKYLGETGDVDAAVVVLETGPETGNRLRREVVDLVAAGKPGGELPTAMMIESAEMLPQDSVRMWARCSITFRANTPERRKDPAEQIKEISRRLGGVLTVLAEANLNPRLLEAEEMTAMTKRAYTPGLLNELELAEIEEDGHDLGWEDAGPSAHREGKSWYYHDGCYSATWEWNKAPTSAITETVLRPVLDVNGELVRKRVAFVYRPHTPAEAADIVQRDYKNALSGRNSHRKGIVSVESEMAVEATSRQREEQGRGHGLTLLGLLITVTVPEDGDLPNAASITDQLSIRSQLRVRRMFLQQAPAFAASLGIGVLLPDHRSVGKKFAK
ncbi:hypothetical protein Gbro_4944 (plasmid) [Gordonia bronchialis DSM 43247]|uniref:Integral membrane protein n=1 Tax=Gordonia bronchialis (strain ATCC 25592 / DSM 43247 / BCRC 13721 / JCM 3198 / KCTC 3076 / NBRC 16047 / NCTC 10667) TaxID=526226 RepID=D0LFK8_GORB4|nr:PrgI family protein [Gordonia bronchialis]ACY24057.1 hypothetical protein Gbro_4944 [Gordonia bronchialis DSM 43247]MCC3326062.1 PrgI family protein [Gordonia bronchialis]QGS27304.1 PrgI family protein [Gordonia bronchialis]STS10861.1 Uncharacterised protein [Gordonia bronchialis]